MTSNELTDPVSEKTTNSASEIELLRQEISRLRKLQREALDLAGYVGMTRQEGAEYDARHSRILALTAQLRILQSASKNGEAGHNG